MNSKKGFDPKWDSKYAENLQMSLWPWSDVVSYFKRYVRSEENRLSVLELGCGSGANIPFFLANKNYHYYGIDGSSRIVGYLTEKYPNLDNQIVCADFTKQLPFSNILFDCIFDRAAITFNDTAHIISALLNVFNNLKSGGIYIGIDWYSSAHSDSQKGIKVDSHTRTDIDKGPFDGLGNVHFSDFEHLKEILTHTGFTLKFIEHKKNETHVGEKFIHSAFNFVAIKS